MFNISIRNSKSVIAYKEQALNSANALAETLNIASGNKKRSEQVNIINAA